jgi:hypothetical protein
MPRILGLLASAALILSATSANLSHADTQTPQGAFYLALGDSLSAGYQEDPTVSWDHGWVFQLRDMLAKQEPTVGWADSTLLTKGVETDT